MMDLDMCPGLYELYMDYNRQKMSGTGNSMQQWRRLASHRSKLIHVAIYSVRAKNLTSYLFGWMTLSPLWVAQPEMILWSKILVGNLKSKPLDNPRCYWAWGFAKTQKTTPLNYSRLPTLTPSSRNMVLRMQTQFPHRIQSSIMIWTTQMIP